ncbi:hypothetical protein OEA41_009690 [Lepraria neglecta]|uniref:Uncharacterized protein n=1 Tax=Lepraria neglecta TaxID=209136 RepID=A0AAD9Z6A6_9LECA|nr:hypothetical protein OEA41_009690 [Lepraria neglecta]
MYLQKLLTVATLLFLGVSSLPQAITTDPSTDTPISPTDTIAALAQEPAMTGAPTGMPTGFGGPGGEWWMRYRGEWKNEGKGNFQSFNPQMKNVQFGSNTKIGGDLTATNTFGSTFQTGTTENLALANDAGAGAGAGAGGDTSLTVAASGSATVYPTGTTKKFRREILGLDDEE